MADQTCPRCGMGQKHWTGNGGQGVQGSDGKTYCCNGCKNDTGCVCGDEDA
jgi:hypothetical protein